MFAHDVHVTLAWATFLALAGVAVEGGVRTVTAGNRAGWRT